MKRVSLFTGWCCWDTNLAERPQSMNSRNKLGLLGYKKKGTALVHEGVRNIKTRPQERLSAMKKQEIFGILSKQSFFAVSIWKLLLGVHALVFRVLMYLMFWCGQDANYGLFSHWSGDDWRPLWHRWSLNLYQCSRLCCQGRPAWALFCWGPQRLGSPESQDPSAGYRQHGVHVPAAWLQIKTQMQIVSYKRLCSRVNWTEQFAQVSQENHL